MSLPQHIIKDQGGTISVELLTRPSSNAVVTVYGPDGSVYVDAQTATITAISATLDGAHVAEQCTFAVSNATNISEGKRLWVRAPTEQVTVKSVSNNDVTVWEPLLHAHATGVDVESTEITYAVSSANASVGYFDGRARWTIDGNITEWTAVECTVYPLPRRATMTDVRRLHAKIADEMDSEDDPEKLLDAAHEDVLVDIGARNRARVFTGSAEFSRAVAHKFLVNHYAGKTGVAMELYEQWKEAYVGELDKVVQTTPRDTNQNGVVEESEVARGMHTVPISRA